MQVLDNNGVEYIDQDLRLMGYDIHDIYIEPLFTNAGPDDFTLK